MFLYLYLPLFFFKNKQITKKTNYFQLNRDHRVRDFMVVTFTSIDSVSIAMNVKNRVQVATPAQYKLMRLRF